MARKKAFAWSYSALTSFEQCERKHNLTRIAKQVKEEESEAMRWGSRVHKALEYRLTGEPLYGNMQQFEPYAKWVENQPGEILVEKRLALTKSFEPTEFFAHNVWVRAVADVLIVDGARVTNLDWKTGKHNPDSDQLKLSAAVTFHHFPDAEVIRTGFIWLKGDGKPTVGTYTRDDVAEIWEDFMPRVSRMERKIKDGTYHPKPSGLCGWCPVGPQLCEHWRERKA